MNAINFYSVADEYGEFSNFADYPITVDGKRWPTSEHYFQAQKFEDDALKKKIRKMASPMKAAREGRNRTNKLRKGWESMTVSVMRKALMAKFTQYPELKELLLSTGDTELVEHTANDSEWGDGGNGKGKNQLGKLLMEVREELRNE